MWHSPTMGAAVAPQFSPAAWGNMERAHRWLFEWMDARDPGWEECRSDVAGVLYPESRSRLRVRHLLPLDPQATPTAGAVVDRLKVCGTRSSKVEPVQRFVGTFHLWAGMRFLGNTKQWAFKVPLDRQGMAPPTAR